MASFIPNHRKKKDRLKTVERLLIRLIERKADRDKLLKVAMEIRDGRIRVLRAKQNENPEKTTAQRAIFLKDQERIRALQAITAEAVLAEYLPSE
jgi:hypothetical protein